MNSFGQALKEQRRAAGMRQQDLVEALDRVIARSTLANVEVGREAPSARLWEAICTHLPAWVAPLEPFFRTRRPADRAVRFELSGPFELEEATYVYTFREHPAPEEIVQVRRVRAVEDGADGYGLKLSNNSSEHFEIDLEPLFGGGIARHESLESDGENLLLTRFAFNRVLAKGQVHTFATRAWTNDHVPSTSVTFAFTRPTGQANLNLNFLGSKQPTRVWHFGPVADPSSEPTSGEGLPTVLPHAPGCFTLRVDRPMIGHIYGLGWQW